MGLFRLDWLIYLVLARNDYRLLCIVDLAFMIDDKFKFSDLRLGSYLIFLLKKTCVAILFLEQNIINWINYKHF